jgi:hypothetical protein
MSLIETIDKIRSLRYEAAKVEASDKYDPGGHTKARAEALRHEAYMLELDMEARLGWRRQ